MGRGAQTQTMQMTDQQLANQNAMNQALYNQGQSLSGTAAGGYQSLLANPGYTPTQQSAINNQSLGALSSAFPSPLRRLPPVQTHLKLPPSSQFHKPICSRCSIISKIVSPARNDSPLRNRISTTSALRSRR